MDWVRLPAAINAAQLLTLGSGDSSDEVLSIDARSGTPLMSVSYTHNDELTVRFQSPRDLCPSLTHWGAVESFLH